VTAPLALVGPACVLLEAAYLAHRADLVRWALGRSRDHALAEDVVQEAFLRLGAALERSQAPDDVRSWLMRVISNLLASRGRHEQAARRHGNLLVERRAPETPEDVLIHAERDAALRSALAELPDPDRAAVVLSSLGYRNGEIASTFGRSDGATRTRLCRARSRLRDQLVSAGFAPA
jgi:RNA polymerase sigma-70 factor (ECF subfamily)